MRIKILSFKVVEAHVMRNTMWNKILNFLRGVHNPDLYHFDIEMKIDGPRLEPYKLLELPNKVRLVIHGVERDVVKAKTYKFIHEDLRQYKPMEMFLIYPYTHGRISDR